MAIARAISERTTVRQNWTADHLNLKSASNVSQRVRQYRFKPEGEKSKQERKGVKKWR